MLWQCPVYDTIRNLLREREVLKSSVHSVISREQALFLGCEIWNRYDFKALLRCCMLIWILRRYCDQDGVTSDCSFSCLLTGDLTSSACVCGCVVNGISVMAAA